MWRRLYDKKGQSTGEYALVFAIILGAIVAMQTYVKRAIQGRVKSGADFMARETANVGMGEGLGAATQYDPYYYTSDYDVSRDSQIQEEYSDGLSFTDVAEDRTTRAVGGQTQYQEAEWQDVSHTPAPPTP